MTTDHKGSPEEWAEWNEDHGPRNVFEPICALHCTVCDGEDHHWLDDCAPDGEPVMVCKHCPAVRDWDENEGIAVMEADIEIAGHELIVEYLIDITSHGCPETGPSYASGGEPAEPAEFNIEVLALRFPKQHADVPELEIPGWLKDILTTHLLERDDINDLAQRIAMDDGPDPDYARDLAAEDREMDSYTTPEKGA